MSISLLDVSVLVNLFSEDALHHEAAQRWFEQNARRGWASCTFTQLGALRILANPAASKHAVRPEQAVEVLRANLSHPAHHFWDEDLDAAAALGHLLPHFRGHQQINDAYLLGLAARRKGRLATFDKEIFSLASASGLGQIVTVISV